MSICDKCKQAINESNHMYTRGIYYHNQCYIEYLLEVLHDIYEHTLTIIAATHNHNAQANSEAHYIKRKLDSIS